MNLKEAKRAIRAKIKAIKADERFSYPPAQVHINAPLALIQVAMEAKVAALEDALRVLDEVRV